MNHQGSINVSKHQTPSQGCKMLDICYVKWCTNHRWWKKTQKGRNCGFVPYHVPLSPGRANNGSCQSTLYLQYFHQIKAHVNIGYIINCIFSHKSYSNMNCCGLRRSTTVALISESNLRDYTVSLQVVETLVLLYFCNTLFHCYCTERRQRLPPLTEVFYNCAAGGTVKHLKERKILIFGSKIYI